MSSTSCGNFSCARTIKCKPIRTAPEKSLRSVVILTLSLILPEQAGATIRWVDALAPSSPGTGCGPLAGYTTIQAAVNAASSGDTISVCPGLYNENVSIPVANLTINGAQMGTSVTGRVSGSPAESTVKGTSEIGSNPVFKISAANVTIDGF